MAKDSKDPNNREKDNDYSLEFVDNQVERINGQIYLSLSPSSTHQRVLTNLSTDFGIYFRNKKCKHIISPFDVILENDNEKNKVQPDIIVICSKKGLNEYDYTGIPTLIVEVLSAETSSKDFIQKMDLYMRFGVKEYWIVSPRNKEIFIFYLENGLYCEPVTFSGAETVTSVFFEDLRVNLQDIF